MISYSFHDIGSDSLYEHLYKCIRDDIKNGVLAAHEKLPAKRPFARNLGVSVITVETAYAQLIAEGYVCSEPKKGYYVTDVPSFGEEMPKTLTKDKVRWSQGEEGCFADFTDNRMEASDFPFSVWAKLTREILTENQTELLTPPPPGGLLELREAIAGHLHRFRDMDVSPEQIIIGAGTEYLYGLLIQLLGFDRVYAVENPGYKKIPGIYQSHRTACEFVSMDDAGVRIREMEGKKVDVLHLSPSHHFPTGRVMPIGRRYELLGWASKSRERYIIEDEYDSEFRYIGKQIPTMMSIDVLEKVIYMNTFTKTIASTVRISYMVLPWHLAERFYETLSFYACTVSLFDQFTLSRFIREGFFEKHINRMRSRYRGKRDALIRCIGESPLGGMSQILEADSGLHFILKIHTNHSDQQVQKRAEANGIRISALSSYYEDGTATEDATHSFLINYSALTDASREEAIRRLYEAVK